MRRVSLENAETPFVAPFSAGKKDAAINLWGESTQGSWFSEINECNITSQGAMQCPCVHRGGAESHVRLEEHRDAS